MLFRLISAISLLFFAMFLMSGTHIDQALYRSLIIFITLFTGVYMSIFFISIIQDTTKNKISSASQSAGSSSNGRIAGSGRNRSTFNRNDGRKNRSAGSGSSGSGGSGVNHNPGMTDNDTTESKAKLEQD